MICSGIYRNSQLIFWTTCILKKKEQSNLFFIAAFYGNTLLCLILLRVLALIDSIYMYWLSEVILIEYFIEVLLLCIGLYFREVEISMLFKSSRNWEVVLMIPSWMKVSIGYKTYCVDPSAKILHIYLIFGSIVRFSWPCQCDFLSLQNVFL